MNRVGAASAVAGTAGGGAAAATVQPKPKRPIVKIVAHCNLGLWKRRAVGFDAQGAPRRLPSGCVLYIVSGFFCSWD